MLVTRWVVANHDPETHGFFFAQEIEQSVPVVVPALTETFPTGACSAMSSCSSAMSMASTQARTSAAGHGACLRRSWTSTPQQMCGTHIWKQS